MSDSSGHWLITPPPVLRDKPRVRQPDRLAKLSITLKISKRHSSIIITLQYVKRKASKWKKGT